MQNQTIDLAIIGAGPCSLALLARLLSPPGLVDDTADFLWGFDSPTESLQETARRLKQLKGVANKRNIKVFDSTGNWMGKWDGLFDTLGIKHLRSPHVMHPCPTHTLALLAHAESGTTEQGTSTSEGNRAAKDEKRFADFSSLHYRGCHRAPSTELFRSLCTHLHESLDLNALLEKASVTAIEPVFASGSDKRVDYFRLTLRRLHEQKGQEQIEVINARTVVVATGSTSCPQLPEWVGTALSSSSSGTGSYAHPPHTLRHAWDLPQDFSISSPGAAPLKQHEHILVVGGGLTAAQLALMAADTVQGKVCLASRRPLEVKQFDFADAWMDRKQRPKLLRTFLQITNSHDRLAMIQQARGLSSLPPEAMEMLTARKNRIDLYEYTEVSSFPPPQWDNNARAWRVILEHYRYGWTTRREERLFDRIWCATGSNVNLEHHSLLGPFFDQCPIDTCGGHACLTPHLAWNDDCELYVLGAPAALVLGPDSSNLMGARTGAVRAAHVLHELMPGKEMEDKEARVERAKQEVAGLQFRFDSKRESVRSVGLRRGDAEMEGRGRIRKQNQKQKRGCC